MVKAEGTNSQRLAVHEYLLQRSSNNKLSHGTFTNSENIFYLFDRTIRRIVKRGKETASNVSTIVNVDDRKKVTVGRKAISDFEIVIEIEKLK